MESGDGLKQSMEDRGGSRHNRAPGRSTEESASGSFKLNWDKIGRSVTSPLLKPRSRAGTKVHLSIYFHNLGHGDRTRECCQSKGL
jgi:hypothetical protein